MANRGVVAVGKISHLVCSEQGPMKAYCGVDLYSGKAPILYVGRVDKTELCQACTEKDKQNDDERLSEYAASVKALSNEDLLEEVYGNVGLLNSDTLSAYEYDRGQRELDVSQAELNARLTACGFLPKKEA